MTANNIPIPLKDVACQDLIIDCKMVHHGNLRRRRMMNALVESINALKQSQIFRWGQSYVVIHNGSFYIYDDEMSKKPERAASLYGFTGVEQCSSEVSRNVSWPFKLVSALEDREKTYYFSAASERDMLNWIKHFQDQLNFANGFPRGRSSTPAIACIAPNLSSEWKMTRDAIALPLPPPPPPRRHLPVEVEYETKADTADSADYTEIQDEDLDEVIASKRKNAMHPSVRPKPKMADRDEEVQYIGAPQYLEIKLDETSKHEDDDFVKAYYKLDPDLGDTIMKSLVGNGIYMIRDSSEPGAQTLVVRVDSALVKYKILKNEQGQFSLQLTGPFFASKSLLLNFYYSNPLPKRSSTLTLPYSTATKKDYV